MIPGTSNVTRTIRLFLLLESISFLAAGLIHFGVFGGDQYAQAATAESVIGAVLLAGFTLSWVLQKWTRAIGIATQGFALTGTFIGVYVSVIGVGVSTVPDIVFHVGILLALLWGLVVVLRAGGPDEPARLAVLAVVHTLVRGTGLLQVALGLAFWTGTLLVAVPFHMFTGLLFVLALEVQAALAAWAGAPRPLVALTVVWGLGVPLLGMAQTQILPGEWHWLVRVGHLLVGLVALGLAERLAHTARHQTPDGRRATTARTSIGLAS